MASDHKVGGSSPSGRAISFCSVLTSVYAERSEVVVAQLVERWLVEPDVAGSSPVNHPMKYLPIQKEKRPFYRLRVVNEVIIF